MNLTEFHSSLWRGCILGLAIWREHAQPDIRSPLYHGRRLSLQSSCNPLPRLPSSQCPFLWHHWPSCCCLHNLYVSCTTPLLTPFTLNRRQSCLSLLQKSVCPLNLEGRRWWMGMDRLAAKGEGHAFLSSVKWNSSNKDIHLICSG